MTDSCFFLREKKKKYIYIYIHIYIYIYIYIYIEREREREKEMHFFFVCNDIYIFCGLFNIKEQLLKNSGGTIQSIMEINMRFQPFHKGKSQKGNVIV